LVATGSEQGNAAKSGDRVGGRYLLRHVVGSGGMGVVWEATNTWTERRVALKFMSVGDTSAPGHTVSPEQVDRFMREARATARVRHPNVVEVLDMGNDPERGGLYIVYDFLEGETLRARLDAAGRLSPDDAAAVLLPAMEGVAEAHRCGVIHRDLKPENIFLTREPRGVIVPRVIDFGIARVERGEHDLTLTRTGAAIGTARYMSPEQCRGDAAIDARTDVWALGVLWYEALTGDVPAQGTGYNQVIASVLTVDARPLRELCPEAPAHLAAAIDRSLARDRDARTPTVDAFLTALRATPASPQTTPSTPRAMPRWLLAPAGLLVAAALAARRSPAPSITTADAGPPMVAHDQPTPTVTPLSPDAAEAPRVADASTDDAPDAPDAATLAAIRRVAAPMPRRVVTHGLRDAATPTPTVTPGPSPNGAPVLEP
jgi:serine/threonine protein kinase